MSGLRISGRLTIPESEIEIQAIRASGPGGQNVNKVSTAIHLRFDSQGSSLPDFYKKRLLVSRDRRISRDGIINIKAGEYRSREKNRDVALERLKALILQAGHVRKRRIKTKPTRSSKLKRLENKRQRGRLKRLRERIARED